MEKENCIHDWASVSSIKVKFHCDRDPNLTIIPEDLYVVCVKCREIKNV
jgi:hypothetical protein